MSLQPLDKTKLQFNKTESSSDEGFEEIEEKSGRVLEQSRRKSKVLICDVCNQKFSMESTLRCHRLEKHQKFYNESEIDENTEESDDEDFEEFSDEDDLASDSTENDDEKLEFQCKFCDRSFHTRKGLKKHSAVHKVENEDSEESVDDEAEIPTEKSEFCKQTSKTLERHNENFAKHNVGNEDQNEKEKKMFQIFQHVCNICHQSFVNKDILAKHSVTHDQSNNENKENEVKSGSAQDQSKRKSTVLIKLKRNQEFRKESHLKNHIIDNHDVDNETKKVDPEPFTCDTCHRQFSCQNTFDIHIDTCRVQRDRSDFDCEDSKAEDTEESVDDEAEIPTEKSEFCKQTSKTLERHNENSAKHNLGNEDQNEKESALYKKLPFPCDHCPRRFTTLVGVRRHSNSMHLKRTPSVESKSLDEDEEEEPLKKKNKVDDNHDNDDEEIQMIPDYSHLPKECIFSCQQCHFRTEVMLEMIEHHESLHVITNE